QALPSEISRVLAQPRDIAPGTRQARHQSDLDRIVNAHNDDRHLRRRTPSGKRCRRRGSNNDVTVESTNLCAKAGKLGEISVPGRVSDDDVPAVDVSARP